MRCYKPRANPQGEPFKALQSISWPGLVHGKHTHLDLIESINGLNEGRKVVARRPVAQPKTKGRSAHHHGEVAIQADGPILKPMQAHHEATVLQQFGQAGHYTHAPPSLVIDHYQQWYGFEWHKIPDWWSPDIRHPSNQPPKPGRCAPN
jgi:hypothetical protein